MGNFTEKMGIVIAAVCTAATWLMGGWEISIIVLVSFMAVDYLTGLMCGYKKAELSSSIGFYGLKKKFTVILILIMAVMLDRLIGQYWIFRTLVCYFYIAMEGLSILENAARLDIPIPDKLKDVLIQLKEGNKKEV